MHGNWWVSSKLMYKWVNWYLQWPGVNWKRVNTCLAYRLQDKTVSRAFVIWKSFLLRLQANTSNSRAHLTCPVWRLSLISILHLISPLLPSYLFCLSRSFITFTSSHLLSRFDLFLPNLSLIISYHWISSSQLSHSLLLLISSLRNYLLHRIVFSARDI